MAGTLVERQLTAPSTRLRFAVATRADDAAIRRLLRESPTPGAISLSFEREPDYFLGANISGSKDQTLLAWDGKELICVGRCSVRKRFLNGVPRQIAYLGELRLAPNARGQFEAVRQGYRFLRELHESSPPDFYFTSIASDNERARRFLERGLPGMPRYRFLTEFVTLVIPVPAARQAARCSIRAEQTLQTASMRFATAKKGDSSALAAFLNKEGHGHQFASVWTSRQLLDLEKHGLQIHNFHLLLAGEKIVAAAALWDQRSFRQTVIRGYSQSLTRLRPWFNLAVPIFGQPRLPPVGTILAHAFLSPLLSNPGAAPYLPDFVESFLPLAAKAGLDYLTLGLPADSVVLSKLRKRLPGREYSSRLYQVSWRDSQIDSLSEGSFLPEVALL